MAIMGQVLTTPETGWRRYEDSDSKITYTGAWSSGGLGGTSGGAVHWTYDNTARFKFIFYGTKFRLISGYDVGSAVNGATLYIDGISKGLVNQAIGAQCYSKLIYEILDLTLEYHTIELVCNANVISGAKNFIFDAIDIDSTGFLGVSIGQALTVPETGWTRYDDSDVRLKHNGTWSVDTSVAYNGGNILYTASALATLTFKFYGTKLRIISSCYTNKSSDIRISIDGGAYETFSEYSAGGNCILTYEKTKLTLSNHTVAISSPQIASGFYWNVDAIDIDDTGYLGVTYFLIKQNTQYYSIKIDYYDGMSTHNYQPLTLVGGSVPTNEDIEMFGIADLNLLLQSTTKNSDTFVPLDKLNSNFEIKMYKQ